MGKAKGKAQRAVSIIALETATERGSVALTHCGNLFSRSIDAPRKSAEYILPLLDAVLQEASLTLAECDAIAFSQGPGSFIGVRLAASIAQGLGLGAKLPVIGMSSLQVLAQVAFLAEQASTVVAALDARMGQLYWASYHLSEAGCMEPKSEEQLSFPERLLLDDSLVSTAVLVGNAWKNYEQTLPPSFAEYTYGKQVYYPTAEALLVLAEQAYREGKVLTPEAITVRYLRHAVAHRPLVK